MGMYLTYVSMHSSCKLYADTALRQAPNLMRFKQEQRKLSESLEWMNEWMNDDGSSAWVTSRTIQQYTLWSDKELFDTL